DPCVAGEVAIKWLECAHYGMPMAAWSALAGPARIDTAADRADFRDRMWPHIVAHYGPHGMSGRPFWLNVYYEELLEADIADVRAAAGIVPFPAPGRARPPARE